MVLREYQRLTGLDLGYPCRWEPDHSERAMPRINDRLLNCVFYLYRSRDAAERGEKRGGTGFIVGVLAPSLGDIWYPVAVSCKHVVHTGGFSYIRINTALNETKIIELEPHEWIAHPD